MKNSRNKLLATALIVITVLMMSAGLSIVPSATADYIDVNDYCQIQGTLHNDTYTLYPYAQSSLDVGFSKYGEMIGYDEDTGIGLGLQYPGYGETGSYDQDVTTEVSTDPFANEQLDIDVWINGWFIDIKYLKVGAMEQTWREIWAFALFSDGASHGGDWVHMPELPEGAEDPKRPLWQEYPPYASPSSDDYPAPKPAYGGRKTNGYCTTEPIDIVYNGPRKFVAVLQTTVKDGTTPLVDIYFTVIFNKVEKNVIVLKDIKRLYDKRALNVAFGDRGEWDLSPPAYVHFYTDEPVQSWDVNGDGAINPIDEGHDFFFKYFAEIPPENKHPKKWWQDVPEHDWPDYIGSTPFESTKWYTEWFETQYTCYGREWHMDETIKDHGYAVAQVIDADTNYVGALAVWPHPEFWSVDYSYTNPYSPPPTIPLMFKPLSRMLEWHKWTVENDPEQGSVGNPDGILEDRENVWVKTDDMSIEPEIPWIVYEHDFRLQMGVMDAYRMVSVYVLTDWHDADDADASDLNLDGVVENQIDREVQYQLDEIFDPWDIWDAMHKNTKRWVEFFDYGYDPVEDEWHPWNGKDYYYIQLPSEKTIETGDRIPTLPVYRNGSWDAYCSFSERVLVDTGTGYELIYPVGYNWLDPLPNYDFDTSPYYVIDRTTGLLYFKEWDSDLEMYVPWYLPEDSIVKVLWSSEHEATTADQWDEDHLLYPINNDTFRFPLHHDIISKYKPYTEVFLIEQPPERLPDTDPGDESPFYSWTVSAPTTLRVDYVPVGKEVDVKYYSYTGVGSWHEEKFVCDNSDFDVFTLSNPASYIEKVWIHSEKALTTGQYVFNNKTHTLYMQDPVPEGQWLFVNYTYDGKTYEDWFYAEGHDAWDRNRFVLRNYTDVGTLEVWNTEIWEEILPEGCYGSWPYGTVTDGVWSPKTSQYKKRPVGTIGPPTGAKCPVPDETYALLPEYKVKTWVTFGDYNTTHEYEECEWINLTDRKVRGNYIIRETSTCDELVLDQPPLNETQVGVTGWPGQELKIVFKVPSGRWEWGTVGTNSAPVDSLGIGMVIAAMKNKLMEFGLGGLDIQDTLYGPRIPSLIREAISPDTIGRYHLHDDWCYSRTGKGLTSSWPISSSNILTAGGTSVNMIAKYFNEFSQALTDTTIGSGYYAVTCWDKALAGRGDTSDPSGFYDGGGVNDRYGYAVISTYKDKNGTICFKVHGWTGQDSYYAAKWFDEHKYELQHINLHVTDLILRIEYKTSGGALRCPPTVKVLEYLGTISEKPQHDCP